MIIQPEKPIFESHYFRLFYALIPANGCYNQRLMIYALPGETDGRLEIIGQLLVAFEPLSLEDEYTHQIDWVKVESGNRRKGIATQMWKCAEEILGKKLVHAPVTAAGMRFAESMADKSEIEYSGMSHKVRSK